MNENINITIVTTNLALGESRMSTADMTREAWALVEKDATHPNVATHMHSGFLTVMFPTGGEA